MVVAGRNANIGFWYFTSTSSPSSESSSILSSFFLLLDLVLSMTPTTIISYPFYHAHSLPPSRPWAPPCCWLIRFLRCSWTMQQRLDSREFCERQLLSFDCGWSRCHSTSLVEKMKRIVIQLLVSNSLTKILQVIIIPEQKVLFCAFVLCIIVWLFAPHHVLSHRTAYYIRLVV